MAASQIAGEIGGGIQITCILEQGDPTVSANAINSGGRTSAEKVMTFATPLQRGDAVALYTGAEATYAATGGLPVVKRPDASNALIIGTIVSTPKLQVMPATSAAANSVSNRITGKYYQVATVELWGGITSIRKCTITTQDQSIVAPGDTATLVVKISTSVAAGKMCLTDVTTGGAGLMALTYVAKAAAATTSILVGVIGPVKASSD